MWSNKYLYFLIPLVLIVLLSIKMCKPSEDAGKGSDSEYMR